jgi:hypothetical protein
MRLWGILDGQKGILERHRHTLQAIDLFDTEV